MTRAWLVDLLTALIVASVAAATVVLAGGPSWAAIGFWWVIYLTRPLRRQQAAK